VTLGDLFNDPQLLSALSAFLGPLAFFAAPTDKVEELVYGPDDGVDDCEANLPDPEMGFDDLASEPIYKVTGEVLESEPSVL
jgi:hypothetical protein